MNLCEPFIRRPIATSLFMAAIALLGVLAYVALPVNDLPIVDFPVIQVSAGLPGADPETMASAVATPLERQFSSIPGLNEINSNSALGATQLSLQFDLDRNIDAAAQDVQAAINQAARLLPPGMPNPPSVSKANPSDAPIVFFSMTSPTLPLSEVTHYAEVTVAPRIGNINGVASLNLSLDKKYAVRIQLDPGLLANNRIGINEVENALSHWNVNMPGGNVEGKQQNFTVMPAGKLLDAAAYRPLVVAYRNGSPVRLEDLGTVVDDVEDPRSHYYASGGAAFGFGQGLNLSITRQPGANAIKVRDAVIAALPAIREQLPPSVELGVMSDRSQVIQIGR